VTVQTHEPPLSPDVARADKGLRTGWTTGTCASAAAKAAAIGLVTGAAPKTVEVGLPGGQRVGFPVECEDPARPNRCVVVKDAGDDPDCTDGARMTATVEWAAEIHHQNVLAAETSGGSEAEFHHQNVLAAETSGGSEAEIHHQNVLAAGTGIGTITKPGLGLPVGAPAINPVPRRMILAALAEVDTGGRPLRVTFEVPGGEAMAAKTSNARLGIVGGISILGTTGIVRPFSTASYRASVVQQIDVAAAQGERTIVLATGSRSDAAAQRLLPHLPPVCFVEVGDFTGIALRHAAARGMTHAVFVGMAGKITKLAAGVMMTHFHRSKVDVELLADIAAAAGSPTNVVQAATATATARHFYEACIAAGTTAPLKLLCRKAKEACQSHSGLAVDVLMVDFDGHQVVARA
jgi:cobalt-precorrin-5B (C1)-methyltransferase